MKIAIITTEYPTESAPTMGSFVRLGAQALAREHEVLVVHFVPQSLDSGERQYQDEGVSVRTFINAMSSAEDFLNAWHIVSSVSHGFSVVQTMNLRSILAFCQDMDQQLTLSCPWVHLEPWTTKTPGNWPVDAPSVESILMRTDALCAVAKPLLDGWEEDRYGMVNEVIPFIVPQASQLAPRDYTPGRIRMISMGSVVLKHQPELAVRTVNTLRKQGIDATLTWVGDGSARLRAQMKAEQLGISSKITWLSQPQVGLAEKALAQSDIFLGPTKEEVFYLSAAQAILAGRPAVLGSGAKDLEYIDPKVVTVMKADDKSPQYAQAVLDTLDRTKDLTAQQIAQTVGDRYTPESVAKRFNEVYQLAYSVGGWSM